MKHAPLLALAALALAALPARAAVQYKGSGAFTANAAAVTCPMPTAAAAPVAGDILLLVVESENQAIGLTTPAGFVEVTDSPQFAGTLTDPSHRIAVYWKRAVGSDAAPTTTDSGDHQTCQIHAFSGAVTSGNPWDVIAAGNDGAANDVTGVIPGATTTGPNTLVVLIQGTSYNATSAVECSAWTNPDLASITERTDNTNTAGLGGGHCLATGTKATQGDFGATAVTLAHTTFKGAYSIALKPQAPVDAEGDTTDFSTRPAVAIINPAAGAYDGVSAFRPAPVIGTFKVQARVSSPSGNITTVQLLVDGAPYATNLSPSPFYGTTATSGVWQVNVSGLTAGVHTLQVVASNASGSVRSRELRVTYAAGGTGDGNLLVRDNASQLCADCHLHKSHSSETTSNEKGSWSVACRDCHTPHSTTNLGLIRQQIAPPSYTQDEAPRTVDFRSRTGGAVGGPANPANNGVCQVCHTQTQFYTQSGGGTTHETGSNCLGCHSHSKGFQGGCTSCHGDDSASPRSSFSTIAPPRDSCNALDTTTPGPLGTSAFNRVGAHEKHLVGGLKRTTPIACSECHIENPTRPTHPANNCSDAVADRAVMTWGTLATTGSLLPSFNYTNQTCGTNYCHGGKYTTVEYRGTIPSPDWNGGPAQAACGTCHRAPPTSSPGHDGITSATNCQDCHSGYDCVPDNSLACVLPAIHIDGKGDGPAGCAGCHGTSSRTAQQGAWGGGETGDILSGSPPNPAAGGTAVQTGPHLAHVYPATGAAQVIEPIRCTECHPGDKSVSHGTDQPDDVEFTSSIRSNLNSAGAAFVFGSPYPATAGSCDTNYCHGTTLPALAKGTVTGGAGWKWDATNATCASCHGLAPNTYWHTSVADARTSCYLCHTTTIDNLGNILQSANGLFQTQHIDGTVDVVANCNSCHGSGTNDAPPVAANTANGDAVGRHQSHVVTGNVADAFTCTECHGTGWQTYTRTHANNNAETLFGSLGTLSLGTGWTGNGNATSNCATSYCHGASAQTPAGASSAQTYWGGAAVTPLWNIAAGSIYQQCNACHGNFPPLNANNHHPPNTACVDCHGAGYLTSGITGAAALASHVDGGVDRTRSGCTECHGDAAQVVASGEDGRIAPGFNANAADSTGQKVATAAAVGAHGAHLVASRFVNNTIPATCTDCHASPMPTNALHATGVGTGGARATVPFGAFAKTGGLAATYGSPTASTTGANYTTGATAGTCASTYCHGGKYTTVEYRGTTPSPSWTGGSAAAACGTCHLAPPTSPGHAGYDQNSNCQTCHQNYNCVPSNSSACVLPSNHIDGVGDGPAGCAGCHGTSSRTAQQGAWGGGETGDILSGSPPAPSAGRGVNQTGPHLAHVYPAPGAAQVIEPVACTECHPGDKSVSHGTDQPDDVEFTSSIRSNLNSAGAAFVFGSPYPGTAGSCATNYCHGTTLPVLARGTVTGGTGWKWDATNATCASCHGLAPNTYWHTSVADARTSCYLCHTTTIDSAGNILQSANGLFQTQHIDGTVDVVTTCWSCHGSAASNGAPPPVANSANLNGAGNHVAHAQTLTTRTAVFGCAECHGLVSQSYTRTHADGLLVPDFNDAGSLAPTTAWADGTSQCSASYCHGYGGTTGNATAPIWKAGASAGLTTKQQNTWGGDPTKRIAVWTDGGDTFKACTACHAAPIAPSASNPHPQDPTCNNCHPTGATPTGATPTGVTALSALAGVHVDGHVDVLRTGCTACHGDPAVAYDNTAGGGNPVNAAPGANGVGRDTHGLTTVAAVGAHRVHLEATGTVYLNRTINCNECHVTVPPTGDTAHAAGTPNVDMTGGAATMLAETGGQTPAYAAGTCSSVYCHGSTLASGGAAKNPSWTGGAATCASCHLDGMTGHYGTTCNSCHTGYTSSSVNTAIHIDGKVDKPTCTTCHANQQGSGTSPSVLRARIIGAAAGAEGDDFIRPSRHVSNGSLTPIVTDFDCIVCHSEGDVTSAGATINTVASLHGPGQTAPRTVDLRDVDSSLGSQVMANWPGARIGTDPRAFTTGVMNDRDRMDAFCMGCHDGDGASAVAVNAGSNGLDTASFVISNSVTRATGTVTVTTTTAHGILAGDAVYLAVGETNLPPGWKTVATVPNTTSFTYTESGSFTVNSTRPRTFKRYLQTAAAGLSRAANSATVTVTTAAAHGLVAGNTVLLFPGELATDNTGNYVFAPGLKTVATAPTATTFTYAETPLTNSPNNTAVRTSTVVQRLTRPGVARAQTPFNASDVLRNAKEPTRTAVPNIRQWRIDNLRVLDVKDQFNSANLAGTGFASHHNLNQFTKRYGTVTTTYPQAAAWTTYVTKEGVTINGASGRDIAGLHCSDCHLNEVNAHGTRNTWYMLANSNANDASADVAFVQAGLPGSTENCVRCHSNAAYGKLGTASSTAPRVDAHDGDCDRINGVADTSPFTGDPDRPGMAALGWAATSATALTGPQQIACLTCHGGLSPGMIHGDNGSFFPNMGTVRSKRYRFMGTGASYRWYSPLTNAYNAESDWAGNTAYTCYTIGAADQFGACDQHAGRDGNPQNGARALTY